MQTLDELEQFWQEWYSQGEYEFGLHRKKIGSIGEYVSKCYLSGEGAYASVSPLGTVWRASFDFDSKEKLEEAEKDSLTCLQKIEFGWKTVGLRLFSGMKGYHCHFFVSENPIRYSETEKDFIHDVYLDYCLTLFGCKDKDELKVKYPTICLSSFGDISRIIRIPFSIHQDTQKNVLPVNAEGITSDKIPDVAEMWKHCLPKSLWFDSVMRVSKKVEAGKKFNGDSIEKVKKWNIRPCVLNSIHRDPSHEARLALALDGLFSGMSEESLIDIFRIFDDFDERYTKYQIRYTMRKIQRGMKPFREEKLRELKICDMSCMKNV